MKESDCAQVAEDSSSNRRLIKGLTFALALHFPLLLNTKCDEIWEERENITYVTKENVKSVLFIRGAEKGKYVDKLKEDLKQGAAVDLAVFYLKTEHLDGRIDEDQMKKAIDNFSAIEAQIRAEMKDEDIVASLRAIVNGQGDYKEDHSYLSSILMHKRGNCQAREKYSASLIQRLYPNSKIAYQTVKIRGVMHRRTLFKIGEKWHNMERPELPLSEEDLSGTVLNEQYDYVRHYAGEKDLGLFIAPALKLKSQTKPGITDDFLKLPLPPTISDNDIKDVDFSVTSKHENSMVEFEVLTADNPAEMVADNRRLTQTILHRWRSLSMLDYQGVIAHVQEAQLPFLMPESCKGVLADWVWRKSKLWSKLCRQDELSGNILCSKDLSDVRFDFSVSYDILADSCFEQYTNKDVSFREAMVTNYHVVMGADPKKVFDKNERLKKLVAQYEAGLDLTQEEVAELHALESSLLVVGNFFLIP